jgi:hypothetical protein
MEGDNGGLRTSVLLKSGKQVIDDYLFCKLWYILLGSTEIFAM